MSVSWRRRGFALAELLVASVLTGIVASLAAKLLLTAAFQLRDRSERMAEAHALRTAAAVFRSALEGLGKDSVTGSDVVAMSASLLSARVIRAAGVVCAADSGLVTVHAGQPWWRALRDPVAGRDSILVAHPADTGWRALALSAPPGSTACPDGSAGLRLPVPVDSAGVAGITAGSPLRVFEPVELKLYTVAPDSWLGMRLLATPQAIQPFAGPVAASGLGISFVRRDGSPALLPAEVAAAGIQFGALTERAGGVGMARGPAPRSDSLRIFIALLNPP